MNAEAGKLVVRMIAQGHNHRTLHEENWEASVSVTASSCGDPLSDTSSSTSKS